MWSSIKHVIKPEHLDEALLLQKDPGTTLFSGGSYLVAYQDNTIHTLLDINHLLNDEIQSIGDDLLLGASCTLQQIVGMDGPLLDQAILASCPSKNIRNQRTIGGEIAQQRPDSDLLILLHAIQAKIKINSSEVLHPISEWKGKGIITQLIIPKNQAKLERVSVLDSAPAFVIVGVNQIDDSISVAIGGKSSRILSCTFSTLPDEVYIRRCMDTVKSIFSDDHFGSPDYKQHVVSKLLQEMVVTK